MSAIVINARRSVDASLPLVLPLDGGFLLPQKRGRSRRTAPAKCRQPYRFRSSTGAVPVSSIPCPPVLGARRRRVPVDIVQTSEALRISDDGRRLDDPDTLLAAHNSAKPGGTASGAEPPAIASAGP